MNTVFSRLGSTLLLILLVFALPLAAQAKTILVFGDSLSAAYGIESDQAWVSLLRERLDQEGLDEWEVANASISGETTDGGLRRLEKQLENHQPRVVILELGGNDALRGFPVPVIRENLTGMIEQSREAGAKVLLVGMQIPPNYGRRYTEAFAALFPELAEEFDTALVPFFLDGIYNQDGLMQGDGIHPTGEAQPKLLDNVWPELQPLLADD